MLRLSETHGLSAARSSTGEKVFIVPSETQVASCEAHVTDIFSYHEDTCRLLDSTARASFVNMDSVINTVDVLQAPAGGGKTQANITLAQNLLTGGQVTKVMMIAFNKAAVLDGQHRTADNPLIVWRTLDSLVWELFKSDFSDQEGVDLDDTVSVSCAATRLFGMPFFKEDVEDFRETLVQACNVGDPQHLNGDGLELYSKGLRGLWWSFSLLRTRALSHSGWPLLFGQYRTIIVDESQDLNLVMVSLLRQLHSSHHLVYTMDSAQKLYGFMKCVNIRDHLSPGTYRYWRFYVTFRHGPAICEWVNERCLPQCCTYASEGTPETQIHYVDDDDIVPGPHTWLINSWYSILEMADRALNAGRTVRMDEDKRRELQEAAEATGWTRHDRALFKKLQKHAVLDVVTRLEHEEALVDNDEIYLTTPHGYKGLQSDAVRVSRCIVEAKARDLDTTDIDRKLYVSVTRARKDLYLPMKKTQRRKKSPTSMKS